MKTYETKTITKQEDVLRSITCDRCGNEMKYMGDEKHFYEGISVRVDAPYGSRYDTGFDLLTYEICDNCWEMVLKDFKSPDGTINGL